MSALLEMKGVSASYGISPVLWDIDLAVGQGEIVSLLGANGAGKTTVLRAICRMMVTAKGAVTFDGERIDGRTTEQIARLGIGHVPDGRGTFLGLTTEENLRLGLQARAHKAGAAADMERVYTYFPRLRERRRQQAGTLSGGEQQMLAIGRALLGKPKLLLLDEPSFGLAPLVVRDIFAIMQRINRDDGVAILLVEQNARLALDVAKTAYLIETGRIVKSGRAEDIRNDDAIRQVYLGG